MRDVQKLRDLLETAYSMGFKASGEGYNAEYPFETRCQSFDVDATWISQRDDDLSSVLRVAEKGAVTAETTATRILEAKGYRYCGGHYWKPPLGEPPLRLEQWRDIETAPKDGTTVLVWNGFCGAYVSRFLGGEWAHALAHFSTVTGFNADLYFPVPSHWMPLPEAPVRALISQAEGEGA